MVRMQRARRSRGSRRGAMLVLIVVLMVVLIVTVVFSVDVAYMQLTRTQLRTATDAAARAAAEALSRTQSEDGALEAAQAIALRNPVANEPLQLAPEDVVFGRGELQSDGSVSFDPTDEPRNSVRVFGRRTADSESGSVSLFFGKILGVGKFNTQHVATSVTLDRDICLVVDRSGSMKTSLTTGTLPPGFGVCSPPHPTLSRWGALNTAVGSFLAGLQETDQIEQLALASYSSAGPSCGINFTDSDLNAPLSENYSPVISEMARLSASPINGFTNIEAGLNRGIQALTDRARARPLAEKTMVLLTDGIFNRGRHPKFAAADAANRGIIIHTITFSDEAEIGAMQEVARVTGGKHFHAPDAAALDRIFREIALTLPVLLTE